MFSIFHSFVDLLYPRLCTVCGRCLRRGEVFLCSGCLVDFPFSDAAFTSGDEILNRIEGVSRPEKFHSLFYYDKYSNYRHLVTAVKYHSRQELGVYLGRMLGRHMAGETDADCIIPVPLHKHRERQRGFNQSLQIAKGVAEVLEIEVLNEVIFRTRDNVSQTGKSVEERQKNVADIFTLKNPQQIEGRHVLVIDDVITTGATISSCLKVLAQVDGVRFSLACLAQTRG